MACQRKTRDEYQILQNCGYGWEEVCAEDTWKEARSRLKEYRENQPEYPVKYVKKRIKAVSLRNKLTGNVISVFDPENFFGTSNRTSDGEPIFEAVS